MFCIGIPIECLNDDDHNYYENQTTMIVRKMTQEMPEIITRNSQCQSGGRIGGVFENSESLWDKTRRHNVDRLVVVVAVCRCQIPNMYFHVANLCM